MKIINRSKKKMFLFTVSVFLLLYFAPAGFGSGGDILSDSTLWKRISMDFKDASLKDVLKIFSQQSGLNFVAADNVEDINLTLYLDDVSVKQALEKILSANNLVYELDPASNIFMVKRSTAPQIKLLTKVFYLKFARVPGSRLGGEIASAMSESLKGLSGGGGGGGGSGDEKEGTSSIVTIVRNILTEFGKIDIDVRTNSIIITDIPQQFNIIEDVIAKLDAPVPQVMIEVEILDVSKKDVDDLGVKWPAAVAALDISGTRATSFPFGSTPHTSDTDGIAWSELSTPGGIKLDDANFPIQNFVPTILEVVNAKLTLNLLKTYISTKSLARPRILTLSNETAEIKIVTDEAIGVKTTTAANEGGTGSVTEEAERMETGVSLRVTPQVDMESGEITMFIQPIVAEATESALSSTFRDPEIRTTKSTVRLKDGNTLLLGGLIKTERSKTRTSLAGLAKIPILGMLFRHKAATKDERELIVFITPHIIYGAGRQAGVSLSQYTDLSRVSFDLGREQALSGRERRVEHLLKEYDIR